MAVAVLELQQMAVVVIVLVAGGGDNVERRTDPRVRWLRAILLAGRRVPHPFCIDTKPRPQWSLGRGCGMACIDALGRRILAKGGCRSPAHFIKGKKRLLQEGRLKAGKLFVNKAADQ